MQDSGRNAGLNSLELLNFLINLPNASVLICSLGVYSTTIRIKDSLREDLEPS